MQKVLDIRLLAFVFGGAIRPIAKVMDSTVKSQSYSSSQVIWCFLLEVVLPPS